MERHDVSGQLQPMLVELTDLALTAKQAHWNVRGQSFRPLHAQLDELADEVRHWSDEVAERLASIGIAADARVETVAQHTPFATFPAGFVESTKVVAWIVERLDEVIENSLPRIDHLGDLDLRSQELLVALSARLEKHKWMFAAQQP